MNFGYLPETAGKSNEILNKMQFYYKKITKTHTPRWYALHRRAATPMLRPSPLGWRYACGGFRNITGGVGGNFVVLG